MAKSIEPLSDIKIKNAKIKDKQYKMFDGGGLYILVKPNGSKLWQMKITINGKPQTLSLGKYPVTSLKKAREKRIEAQRDLADGIDPRLRNNKQKNLSASQINNSFELIAREWWNLNKARWVERHANDVINTLERRIFPDIGKIIITNIDTPLLLGVLQKIENTGAIETAHRIRQRIEAVFNYAISKGIAFSNPATVLKGALRPIVQKRQQPAITDLHDLQQMMNTVTNGSGRVLSKLAFRLLALLGTRSGEFRQMRWDQIEGDVWTIPAEQMKMKKAFKLLNKRNHKVFLSRQALEILELIRPLSGDCPYVFPNSKNALSYMSENTIGKLINTEGFEGKHTPHGFRTSLSTILNEHYPQDSVIIDLMLAHINKNAVEAAYNRSQHEPRRRELYQIWADILCDGLTDPADIIKDLKRRQHFSINCSNILLYSHW